MKYFLWALLVSLIIGVAACSTTPTEVQLEGAPAHHTNRGFRNIHVEDPQKSFFSFLRMRLFGDVKWADHAKTADNVPYQKLDIEKVQSPQEERLQVSWLGHSTFLVQYQGRTLLTDPIFSDRASPVSFGGPKRYVPHVMDYADLPPIDYVVISHNHYDHLDKKAVKILGDTPRYFVPLGVKDWFVKEGISPDRIEEMDWWQQASASLVREGDRIEAQPSQHWSARGLGDRRETLWASWRIELGGKSIWFAGDTGYNRVGFKEIGDRSGPVDLALIPIGAYDPRFFMKTYHVDPDEAVEIHKDVRAKRSIGMHWGTFPLTAEEPMDPPARLIATKKREGISDEAFMVLSLGETKRLP